MLKTDNEDLAVINIKLGHFLIELSSDDKINYSIISFAKDGTYKYEHVLERDKQLLFELSNLEDHIDEIYLLIFKPNYAPEERPSNRLLEEKSKLF